MKPQALDITGNVCATAYSKLPNPSAETIESDLWVRNVYDWRVDLKLGQSVEVLERLRVNMQNNILK